MPTKVPSIPQWPSGGVASRWEYAPRWARPATASTMHWPRASSPPWNVSGLIGLGSVRKSRRKWRCFNASRVGLNHTPDTPQLAISRPWSMKGGMLASLHYPSPQPSTKPGQLHSVAFLEACRALQIHQAFTSDNNPKGNADTERFMRTLKEECLWLREWTCPL